MDGRRCRTERPVTGCAGRRAAAELFPVLLELEPQRWSTASSPSSSAGGSRLGSWGAAASPIPSPPAPFSPLALLLWSTSSSSSVKHGQPVQNVRPRRFSFSTSTRCSMKIHEGLGRIDLCKPWDLQSASIIGGSFPGVEGKRATMDTTNCIHELSFLMFQLLHVMVADTVIQACMHLACLGICVSNTFLRDYGQWIIHDIDAVFGDCSRWLLLWVSIHLYTGILPKKDQLALSDTHAH